ncbi:hypothetical protein SAMCCGM7_pC0825 (plasmid) [Sinorhizobium americanum CCGM7]|nr:hypothetical protein SAMCCGM7_pC0825 [Sinorhizobium americanum CCGM7]
MVGRQHLKEGVISLRTGKTGARVYLPVFKRLLDSLEATPTRRPGIPDLDGKAVQFWSIIRELVREAVQGRGPA